MGTGTGASIEARALSRRQVLRTAAWAAPVVALAVAAPAAAASGCGTALLGAGTWSTSGSALADAAQAGWTYPAGSSAAPATGTVATSDWVFRSGSGQVTTSGVNLPRGFVSSAQGPLAAAWGANLPSSANVVNYQFPVATAGRQYTLNPLTFRLWSALGTSGVSAAQQHIGQSLLIELLLPGVVAPVAVGSFSYSYLGANGNVAPYTAVPLQSSTVVTHTITPTPVLVANTGTLTVRYTYLLPNRRLSNGSARDYNADIWSAEPTFQLCVV